MSMVIHTAILTVVLMLTPQTERDAQMLAMLLQEAQRRELFVEPRSLGEPL